MEHSSIPYKEVTCTTIDGTVISAWLYATEGPAPAIIMSHGFNCVKSMTLPEIAEVFQCRGFNVIIYDARNVGESGGHWRNLVDPLQMAEDLSDIYTFVAGLESVDSDRIALWGMSLGAVVSSCCAAIDRRPKALIMLCPLLSYVQPQKAEQAYATIIRDRVSQLRGNDPFSLAPFNSCGDNLIGLGGAGGPGGIQAYNLMAAATSVGDAHFRDQVMVQTYQKLAMFRPKEYLDMLSLSVLIVIPEFDDISPPAEQREALARITCTKEEYVAKGKAHLDVATGPGSEELLDVTINFLNRTFDGNG
ncbi:MAG: hypothetical protein M1828_001115 [Chrysothrix sp. TS-e1954]|nr:MAG: hypothetical protein M1828_001115 [Chrysothrix sp. TS-e1954]